MDWLQTNRPAVLIIILVGVILVIALSETIKKWGTKSPFTAGVGIVLMLWIGWFLALIIATYPITGGNFGLPQTGLLGDSFGSLTALFSGIAGVAAIMVLLDYPGDSAWLVWYNYS